MLAPTYYHPFSIHMLEGMAQPPGLGHLVTIFQLETLLFLRVEGVHPERTEGKKVTFT